MAGTIRYVHRDTIDPERWDQCLDQADNGRIYAYSFYLDTMADHWDALILGDYEAMMPLTWRSKFGIRYLYQPFLTAQLGVFGKDLPPELVDEFLTVLPKNIRLAEIALNDANYPMTFNSHCKPRNNFILPLSQDYEVISRSYSENTSRNIRKALQEGYQLEKGFDADRVIALAMEQMQRYDRQSAIYIDRFRKLYRLLLSKKMATTYGISRDGQLLSSAVFFYSHQRAYYILVGNHPESRKTGASHALIDAFIRDHAGQSLLLDFEGSDIPGLAAFYSSFGAVNAPYPFLTLNRLPVYLKWLKS